MKYPMLWDSLNHSLRSKKQIQTIIIFILIVHKAFQGAIYKMQTVSKYFLLNWPFLHLSHSFHDGNLNFYRPDTTGYYDGSTITGLNSPKVKKYKYLVHIPCFLFGQCIHPRQYIKNSWLQFYGVRACKT